MKKKNIILAQIPLCFCVWGSFKKKLVVSFQPFSYLVNTNSGKALYFEIVFHEQPSHITQNVQTKHKVPKMFYSVFRITVMKREYSTQLEIWRTMPTSSLLTQITCPLSPSQLATSASICQV